MNRWALVTGAILAALLVAIGAGAALTQLAANAGTGHPVVMKTVTPGALDQAGIHLTGAAVPPGCGLPVHLPGCPVTQAAAEAAAVKVAAKSPQPQVRESVLARVDANQTSTRPVSIHGLEWVVAVDRPFPIGVMMCIRPVLPPAASIPVPNCGTGRYLVFIDAATGNQVMTIARP